MKNWWLDLYTIPSLKVLLKAFVIVYVSIWALILIEPGYAGAGYFLALYMSHKMGDDAAKSMLTNIEFHKLHIPYPALKNAFLKDISIRYSFLFLAWFVCVLTIRLCGDSSTGLFEEELVMMLAMGNMVLLRNMLSINKVVNGKLKYEVYNTDHLPSFVKFGLNLSTIAFLMVSSVGLLLLEFNPVYPSLFCVASMLYFYNRFSIRATFHQIPAKGSFKGYLGMGASSIGAGIVAYSLCALIISTQFNNQILSATAKVEAVDFLGPFTPDIEVGVAREMMVGMNRDLESFTRVRILRHTSGAAETPITSLWKDPTTSEVVDYIVSVKKPSAKNIEYILSLTSIKKFDRREVSIINSYAVKKWPKGQKFPDHLLAKKISTDNRLPASTKN